MVTERDDIERCRARQVACGRRAGTAHRQRRRRQVTRAGGGVFFSASTPQQMRSPALTDWLAGAATVVAAAAWIALLSALAG